MKMCSNNMCSLYGIFNVSSVLRMGGDAAAIARSIVYNSACCMFFVVWLRVRVFL